MATNVADQYADIARRMKELGLKKDAPEKIESTATTFSETTESQSVILPSQDFGC